MVGNIARSQKIEAARFEYEQCRAGIANYDEYLFRIRTWNFTLSILIIAGTMGVNVNEADGFDYEQVLSTFLWSSFMFWTLDAYNKSLQMVHIVNSRRIEKFLRSPNFEIYLGPSISLRFEEKQKNHVKNLVKNFTDQSVFIFYVIPIFILTYSFSKKLNKNNFSDGPLLAPLAVIFLALAASFYLKLKSKRKK